MSENEKFTKKLVSNSIIVGIILAINFDLLNIDTVIKFIIKPDNDMTLGQNWQENRMFSWGAYCIAAALLSFSLVFLF